MLIALEVLRTERIELSLISLSTSSLLASIYLSVLAPPTPLSAIFSLTRMKI